MTKIKMDLSLQIIIAVIISLFCSVVIFMFLSKFDRRVMEIMHDNFITDKYEEKINKEEVRLFQQFVTENKISSREFKKITKYLNSKPYLVLIMYDKNKLVYDSSYPQMRFNREENKGEDKSPVYRPRYEIKFRDKVLNIELVAVVMHFYFFIMMFTKFILSFASFLGILLLQIRKKVKYIKKLINEVNILESGNLNYKITIKDNDEITYLAKSIDAMRLSMLERLAEESKALNANHNLVTAMSHDLRTPLTILIGFLEILENKKYKTNEQLENYIYKSREKAYQIKQMSDKLFEYFLAYSLDDEKLNLKNYPITVLSEIIEDYIFSLEEDKFNVNYSPLECPPAKILIDADYINRVFANIFSNITKYADKEKSINITVKENLSDEIIIKIENTIISNIQNVESTNIGLETCKKIMYSHEGKFTAEKKDNIFIVTVTFVKE